MRLFLLYVIPSPLMTSVSGSVILEDDEDYDDGAADLSKGSSASSALNKGISQSEKSDSVEGGGAGESTSPTSADKKDGKKPKKIKIAQELSDITWMPGKFDPYEQQPHTCTRRE